MTSYSIGVDVGTGSVRCMFFDEKWTPVVQCQKPIKVFSFVKQKKANSRFLFAVLDFSFIGRTIRIRTIIH